MESRLGNIIRTCRGKESRLSFVKKLGLSYTFVRSLEEGLRLPSDDIIQRIADRLELDADELTLATYSDRSERLARILAKHGLIDGDGSALGEPEPALPRRDGARRQEDSSSSTRG